MHAELAVLPCLLGPVTMGASVWPQSCMPHFAGLYTGDGAQGVRTGACTGAYCPGLSVLFTWLASSLAT